MKAYQLILMLLLTLAVGALFLFGVPRNENEQIATLSARVTQQQQTIQFLQQQPTLPPVPTAVPITPSPQPQTGFATIAPSPLPIVTLNPAELQTNAQIVNVQTSLEVSGNGCAANPQNDFSVRDTIYGVVTLANVGAGDTLNVSFNFDTNDELIYEDFFTIQEPGNFCRWYVVEPDSLGWETGSYTLSYQLNSTPPTSATYFISGGSDPSIPDLAPDDAMSEDAMMEEGQ